MATAADVRALEAECPWLRVDFQDDLALLRESTAEASRRFAADVRVLARLVAQVPRCRFDERGPSPWTSLRREVAVARSLSDMAAAAEIRTAVRLTGCMPVTLALLEAGRITVPRARKLVDEVAVYDDDLVVEIDRALAERVAGLPAWRIVQEVRRLAATLDPEAGALRVAANNAGRSVLLEPLADDQAVVLVQGPAVPLTRWYDTVDGRARTLKAAGDPRTLAQLRFDLATSGLPCAAHVPGDTGDTGDTGGTGGTGGIAAAGGAVAFTHAALSPAGAGAGDAAVVVNVAGRCADGRPAAAAAAGPAVASAVVAGGLRPNYVEAAWACQIVCVRA